MFTKFRWIKVCNFYENFFLLSLSLSFRTHGDITQGASRSKKTSGNYGGANDGDNDPRCVDLNGPLQIAMAIALLCVRCDFSAGGFARGKFMRLTLRH